mgnify:CR=1 FL=1
MADLFKSGANVWSLGLAAAMPLFDAGRTSARVDQATARQKQALAGYQKTVHTAFKEVNDALVGLRDLLGADDATLVGDLMREAPVATADTEEEAAARVCAACSSCNSRSR